MTNMLDTNHPTTGKLDQLKSIGIRTIIRYINPLSLGSEKTVKPAEARGIAQAGLRLGLVCEGWGGAKSDGIGSSINFEMGSRDAKVCLDYAPSVGAPDGACIYFAVDVDASDADIRRVVIPYFQAINEQFSMRDTKYVVGIYGPGAVCQALLDHKLVTLTWLSNAMGWNGSRAFYASNRWNIIQQLPRAIAGLDTDPDVANPALPPDGCFVPWGPSVEPKQPAPVPTPEPAPTKEPTVTDPTTPTPAPVVQLPALDLAKIESLLDTLASFASSPLLAPFIPAQAKAFLPLIPVIKEVLDAVKQWQGGAHDLHSFMGILSELMADVSRELQNVKASLAKPV